MEGVFQPDQPRTGPGDTPQQRPLYGVGREPQRVDEGVVVPLEGVKASAMGNYAVQDGRVQERALVGDDLADVVAARRPQHGQITGLEHWQHARTVRGHD